MGKICLVMYGIHTPEIDAKIIASAPLVDMFIANTNAGMYHTPVTPDKFQAAGIKVFSYGDGSYETRPLAENLAFVDAISKEGCYGFFLDQVSAFPDTTALTYLKAIYDNCKIRGLKLMVNTGVSDWSDALMSVCDYVMSNEQWYDSPLTPSQSKWLPRVIVVSNSVPTLSQAVDRTKAAWARGYSWHYACADNIYNMSNYFTEYITMCKELVNVIKEILVVLQKIVKKGSLRFMVVETVPNPDGFPTQQPIVNAKVTILQAGNLILTGFTTESGIYQADYLPVGLYNWQVEIDGYETQIGSAEVVE